MKKIEYFRLTKDNFHENDLDNFKRRQVVTSCWRKEGEKYVLKPICYTEDWSINQCRKLSKRILDNLALGAAAIGAFCNNEIVGFAFIEANRFGTEKQYINLSELNVSEPFRRQGIGRNLFKLACDAARELGARKLYISAHSAKESISAYISYGCTHAKEINKELAEKEPCDLQLEYSLV